MAEPLRCVPYGGVITGWDFSTGGVKCLAFSPEGQLRAEVRLPTDLWFGSEEDLPPRAQDRVSELNLMQLEGQARASTRAIAARLREAGCLHLWAAGGISATHHTSGRIDPDYVQVRRAICWNDQTLAKYHEIGLARLGGQARVRELVGGPWAVRYSLSHLVKDEIHLKREDWRRTFRILPHGSLAAGYLTGNFGTASVSAAASTGIMDLSTGCWRREMLAAMEDQEYRELAWRQLPRIVPQFEPLGRLAGHVAVEAGIEPSAGPWIYPTSDDQQAGLIGGGAVEPGQLAIVLGNSAVVNSSSANPPAEGSDLDVMRLNWGPYLWMRCYQNGAQFLDAVVGENPDWNTLEQEARACPAGADGAEVLPFVCAEPSLGVASPVVAWLPKEPPRAPGRRCRAAFEAIAYLIALGVREHERAGQRVSRITVSGGIARSSLMCEILATVLDRRLERLESDEGPALGAAVTALAALEANLRRQQGIKDPFEVRDAVAAMVKFRSDAAEPNSAWTAKYVEGLRTFENRLQDLKAGSRR